MKLSTIKIKNYRLLVDAELDVHKKTTLIVGRNNTAKTSCIGCVSTILDGKSFLYDDYPLEKRKELFDLFSHFMEKTISYDKLCQSVQPISVEFLVDYSAEQPEDYLGALSPFIIDVDIDTTVALISIENRIKMEEAPLRSLLEKGFYRDGVFSPDAAQFRDIVNNSYQKIFGLTIYAINPKNKEDRQIKTHKELSALFPYYCIPAERALGEDGSQSNSLSSLISSYFDVDEANLDPTVAKEVINLRHIIEDANKSIQKQSDEILSSIVKSAIGFGYPNAEELQLGVITSLTIDDQIKNQTRLSYTSGTIGERLPSTHNGLGYKNLIKMEFLLAAFAKEVEKCGEACIPLLFIEEPESHMHPQMQHAFADYLESFLEKISNVHIQTVLTSHSAHIANTIDFSKIRYAQKVTSGVVFKNMNAFAEANKDNMTFIRKYLTLSRCDLFFADKIIFVEGASERLLLPDIIDKCDKEELFASQEYKLPAQYYTIIEVGGAYAYKFIPFADFLGVPCLILTDIDSMAENRTKAFVSVGKTTSNSTIKWWMRKVKGLPETDQSAIDLKEIVALTASQKTLGKSHLEFQVYENGLCARSLEEAMRNVNRDYYSLSSPVSEESIEYTGKSKTDFALDLIYNNPNYETPKYIQDGLVWLNEQKVLV